MYKNKSEISKYLEVDQVNDLVKLLEGGDLRSDGHADEVAEDLIRYPKFFSLLIDGLNE